MKDLLASLPQFQEQRDKVGRAHFVFLATCLHLRFYGQFSLHLSMAQECMAIFERDKLPAVANVEQVPAPLHFAWIKEMLIEVELRHWRYSRGQNAEDAGRRDGPTAR